MTPWAWSSSSLRPRIRPVSVGSVEHWPEPIAEWIESVRITHANGLFVGPDDVIRLVLDELRPCFEEPMLETGSGTAWDGERLRTLVLDDVISLSAREQSSLFAWLDGDGRDCQVISFACLPVFPFVVQRGFLAPLYYRLNCAYTECWAMRGLMRAMERDPHPQDLHGH